MAILYQFGDLEIDTNQMIVKRAGSIVPLTSRPYALLKYLIENKDRIVTKQEMIDVVWARKAVSDAALTTAVRELRKAIGDPGGRVGLIRTVYGCGLRFVAPDESNLIEAAPAHPPRRFKREQSIVAILPFEVQSTDPKLKFTGDSISDEIIAKVSRFGLIGVLSRSSSYALRGLALSTKEMGERLSANYILAGTVRQVGFDLRISTQLIDVDTQMHVWTNDYDLSANKLDEEQQKAVTNIATSTITVIYESESKRASGKPFEDLTAWESYCLGYALFCTLDPKRQDAAAKYLQRSIELKPEFTEAYATLAYAICVSSMTPEIDPQRKHLRETCYEALELARRALSIDARVPFAWVALGRCHFALGGLDEAIFAARKALELNPNLGWAHNCLAMYLLETNSPGKAIEHFDRALQTSPLDALRVVAVGGKAIAMVLLKNYERAIALSRQAQLLPSAGLTAHLGEVCALGHLGRREEALKAIRKARLAYGDFGISALERQNPFVKDPSLRHLLDGLKLAGICG